MGSFGLLCATVLKNSLRVASGARRAGVIVGELTRIQILEVLDIGYWKSLFSAIGSSRGHERGVRVGGGIPSLGFEGGHSTVGQKESGGLSSSTAPPQCHVYAHTCTCTVPI